MADAVYDTVATDVEGDGLVFHAAAQRVAFPGWLAVSPVEEKDTWLPPLTVGEELTLAAVTPEQHYTEPPPRYNDASLVRALEGFGIGRPSTYAPIVATILERGYVERRSRAFYATELGKLVNALLVAAFPDVFNVKFTAHVESELDRVEEGNTDGVAVLREFYAPFAADLTRAADVMNAVRDDAVEVTDVSCPKCGAPMEIRWGRFGKYLRCQRHPDCRETMDFERDASGKVVAAPPAATGEVCPSCGAPMVVKQGRFGKFLACTKYPECKTTKPIRKKTGAVCPKCGGEVLVIPGRGRGKRPFYGCAKYPDCDFVSSSLPVNEPCPKCGSPYLVKGRGGSSRCPVKGCGYKNAS
jgi:DNA topoisomerase-1